MNEARLIGVLAVLAVLLTATLFLFYANTDAYTAGQSISLHVAAASFPEQIEKIVAGGADVNSLDNENKVTALLVATTLKNRESVSQLLSLGADPNVMMQNQDSPLTVVASDGDAELFGMLLDAGADVNGQFMSRCPLHNAIIYGRNDIFEALIEHPDVNINQLEVGTGYTPLHLAVQHDRLEFVSRLLELGANSEVEDDAGNTALELATHKSDSAIADQLRQIDTK